MRPGIHQSLGGRRHALILTLALAAPATAVGQEPGFFGRLFRPGGGTAAPRPIPNGAAPVRPVPVPAPDLRPLPAGPIGLDAPGVPPATPIEPMPMPMPTPTPVGPGATPSPRIVPQPRVSRGATEADPIVTRITIGRADDGQTFGIFLQVFADGTVIDSSGVHALGREAVRGVLELLQSGEVFRLRGHCGGPPTDFVEQVHVTVFDRGLGRLRASSFSFSGNPQGCDPSIPRLQQALDALQARISPAPPASIADAAPSPSPPDLIAPAPLPPPIRLNEGP